MRTKILEINVQIKTDGEGDADSIQVMRLEDDTNQKLIEQVIKFLKSCEEKYSST